MTLSFLISTITQLLIIAIIARAILSWFPVNRTLAPVATFVNEATDPLIRPIQQRLNPLGGFDFSPMIAIFLIVIVQSLLLTLLAGH